jgi:uncharacterized protein (DUF427 family)
MPKAIWNGAIIAEAHQNEIHIVENNVYFPVQSVNSSFLQASEKHTVCGWKGTASYYSLIVDGIINKDAAWFYPEPKEAAKQIAGYIAFWRGVMIEMD